ncbi:MAG TPA: transglutaminaseTgpA domain-containing protein [Ktedonobacterales bacterium]|nr:transglutaminaseTgpA domain-containing protein [Ktedonobacterales bacterium]
MQTSTITPEKADSLTAERPPWLRLLPEDGWLTLVLLAIMVYTTISSIQSVTPTYAPGLGVLTVTTLAGIVLGYLVVQQGRLPGSLVHTVAVALGVLFAFKATADEVLGGDRGALWQHTTTWFNQVAVQHGSSNDNDVFLLFLAILSFLLAYISVWLVLHTRRPWLAALANAIVLLINLNFATTDKALFFLVLYLLATLLLLVRFTLADNIRMWRTRGLRFSPDLGWDFMQAGAIFAVIVLLLAYLLPAGSANQTLLTAWNSTNNPWQQLQNTFASYFSGLSGNGPGGGSFNFFSGDVQLRGKVNLPNVVILRYTLPKTTDDYRQYLLTQTYDTYNGTNAWTNTAIHSQTYRPGDVVPQSEGVDPTTLKTNAYDMVFQFPQGNHLFVPGAEPQSFNTAADVYFSTASNAPVQWYSTASASTNTHYVTVGYVSNATVPQLEAVPYARDLSPGDLQSVYPTNLLNEYLPNEAISPAVVAAAQEATRGTTNMYDAAIHIQDYLRTFKYSTNNPEPPAGQDAVAWFLQVRQGFCTFFASAMAEMGRALGMPTRIGVGFAAGQYDGQTQAWAVKGTDAHVWTQIYFGKYGWINFEPTSSFATFPRAIAGSGDNTPTAGGAGGPTATPVRPILGGKDPGLTGGGGGPAGPSTVLLGAGLGASLLIILLLLAMALFALWWRLLFRGLPPVATAFGRISRLGAWAGAPPARWQTPDEYAERLGELLPTERTSLRQLSALYGRERWGGGLNDEQVSEIPPLYDHVRRTALPLILQRARMLPGLLLAGGRRLSRRARGRR